MARSTVPGAQPGKYASTRMKWDNPLLEPKQQHRFICYFPVYMAMGSESDSKKLADQTKRSTTWETEALKAFPDGDLDMMKAATNKREFASGTVNGDDECCSEEDLKPARDWFDANKRLPAGALAARISSYVVSSFTPPSYGATIGMAPIVATPGVEVADDSKTKLKMDQVQITLVSTLQDDLHFSLNYLYNIYAPDGGDAENVLVKPYLFPTEVWGGDKDDKYLTVLDMGARQWPGPDVNAALLGRGGGEAARDMAKLFPSQIVGIHKFRAPFVTGISFSEYSYKGDAFLEATVTLGSSIGVADFYSYETYNAGGSRGGDTRYGGYSGLQDERNVNAFQDAIAATYGDYPNFSMGKGSWTMGSSEVIMKDIRDRAALLTEQRQLKIDFDMSKADRAGVIGRRGTLDRMLESKVQQEAAAEAKKAEEAADAENPRPAATFPPPADRQASRDPARARYEASQASGEAYDPAPDR